MKTNLFLCLFLLFPFFSMRGQVYDFPVKPGTPEWGKLNGYQEMIEVCRIPEKLLSTMNTGDLLETCLNHPFRGNASLYTTPEESLRVMANTFNAFEELIKRNDIGDYLLAAVKSVADKESKANSGIHKFEVKLNGEILQALSTYPTVKEKLSEDVKNKISAIFEDRNSSLSIQTATIYTPNGCLVSDTDYTPEIYDSEEKTYWNQYYQELFPQNTLVGSTTSTYNCHAYAWHMTEGGSAVWMGLYTNPTSVYWTDGSYSPASTATAAGLKVSYASDNHSAVTTGVSGEFISKWGNKVLMRHMYYNCPYTYSTLNYYKKNQLSITGRYAQNSTWHTLNTVNFVAAAVPITLNVDYPGVSQFTWQLTSGGSDVTWAVQSTDGKVVNLTIYTSPQASLRATAHSSCKTVSTEFYFNTTSSYTVRYDQARGLIDIIFNEPNASARKTRATYQLTIVDVNGTIAKQLSFSDNITVDISSLKENIYYLHITDGTAEGTYQQSISK
jgi:hypothetical protein